MMFLAFRVDVASRADLCSEPSDCTSDCERDRVDCANAGNAKAGNMVAKSKHLAKYIIDHLFLRDATEAPLHMSAHAIATRAGA
jgi:hypothetical protein